MSKKEKRKKLIEKFYNELDNEITISVEKTDDVNKEKKKRFDAISLIMECPASTHENIITNLEAIKMRDLLDEFIESNNVSESIVKDASKNKPRKGMKSRWSVKRKRNIDCNNPKGFSQKQYCKRKKRGGKYKDK